MIAPVASRGGPAGSGHSWRDFMGDLGGELVGEDKWEELVGGIVKGTCEGGLGWVRRSGERTGGQG